MERLELDIDTSELEPAQRRAFAAEARRARWQAFWANRDNNKKLAQEFSKDVRPVLTELHKQHESMRLIAARQASDKALKALRAQLQSKP